MVLHSAFIIRRRKQQCALLFQLGLTTQTLNAYAHFWLRSFPVCQTSATATPAEAPIADPGRPPGLPAIAPRIPKAKFATMCMLVLLSLFAPSKVKTSVTPFALRVHVALSIALSVPTERNLKSPLLIDTQPANTHIHSA